MKRIMKRIMQGALLLVLLVVVLIGGRIILGLLLQERLPALTPEEEVLRARALELHHEAIVVDGHDDVLTYIFNDGYDLGMDGDELDDRSLFFYYGFPWLPNRPYGENVHADMDLARIQEGGLDAQFFVVYVDFSLYESGVPGQSRQRALDMIEVLQEQERHYPNDIEIAYTSQDVERIISGGKLAVLIGLEGGHAIEDDLETLANFHELGVLYMTLTHTGSHNWADSSEDESRHGGLSEFGRKVVQEMNRLGIIVDVSHVSDDTFWDVVKVSKAPIIASHSNARALADHVRNMDDDMLRAVAANGGVVMVNFMTIYLDPEKMARWKLMGWHWFTHPRQPETPLSLLVDHIDHIVQVAGVDHVGLGSDFDNTPFLPEGLKDVGDYPNLTVELVRRGYSDQDVRKILGGNLLRVLADVEAVAAQPL